MPESNLRASVLALSHALDPEHQGEQWPDPIAWDGRPLAEQARDLQALASSQMPYGPAVARAFGAVTLALTTQGGAR